MKTGALVATLLVVPMVVLSAWALTGSQGAVEPQGSTILAEPPDYVGGYGFDPLTDTMEDTNGFRYSYQPDGIVQLDLPWGYTTYFSFGLTADYLGSPEQRTALDYTWVWDTTIGVAVNETGNFTGYTYAFTATSQDGVMDWTIRLEFSPTSRMKVTHTLENDYASDLTNVKFWYLFDLRGTATPYTIETSAGIVEGPLYQAIPDGVHWVRLGNQFQFDWSDALEDYENGHAYIGDGSVVGLDGLPILGISIELGDIAPGQTITVDPYFSGVEKTWDAGSAGDASGPANWDPVGVPDTGDNITFDGTSVFNCDWNVEVTLGDFSMLAGYTGVVSPSVDFGCADFTVSSGTYTSLTTLLMTCESNFTYNGGLITDSRMKFQMTGTDKYVSFVGGGVTSFVLLNVTGTITFNSAYYEIYGVQLAPGASIILALQFTQRYYSGTQYLFENYGTIDGASTYIFKLYNGDKPTRFGVMDCPVKINLHNGQASNRTVTLLEDTDFGSSLEVISADTTEYSILNCSVYDLTVAGGLTVGTRGIVDQWSGDITIGGDLTVSGGIFYARGDMTVPGDWDTATGDYVNDDNVVTLTGASKTLAMHADDSFYNITVSGTYTMDTDTTVRVRATITGTVDGTGDFLEPDPEFTSEGWPHACPMELYEYEVTQTYWDTLAIYDGPYWLHVVGDTITGVPNDNDTGVHLISLTLTWNDMTVYQNYTIIVCPSLLSEADKTTLSVVLSLVMGFGLLGLAIWRNTPLLMVFAGLVFMFSAVAVYKDINLGWTMLSMGIGMLFLYSGGLQFADESES